MLFFIAFIGIVMFVISRFNIAASSFEEEALAERNRQETRRKQHALLLQPLPGSGTHQVTNVDEKQFSLQEKVCEKEKAAQRLHRALFLQPEPGSGVHRQRK